MRWSLSAIHGSLSNPLSREGGCLCSAMEFSRVSFWGHSGTATKATPTQAVLAFPPLNSGFCEVLATSTQGFPPRTCLLLSPWRREIPIRDNIHWITTLCQGLCPHFAYAFHSPSILEVTGEVTESQRHSVLHCGSHGQGLSAVALKDHPFPDTKLPPLSFFPFY